MKHIIPAILFCAVCSCTVGEKTKDGTKLTLPGSASGHTISLSFTRGEHFSHEKIFGFGKVNIRPQLAVWIEDTAGKYLQTIYVTKSFGTQKWGSGKPGPNTCFRPMCMPYWLNRYKVAGNNPPTPKNPLPDGITSATPTGSFTLNFSAPDSLSTIVLFTEWNNSFDNNEHFTKKEVSFNGQPSVVASTLIAFKDSPEKTCTLTIKGYGGNSGDDSELYTDSNKLTTAKTIFKIITATVQP